MDVPQYRIRGIDLHAFSGMSECLDYLCPNGRARSGTLVAINAEKVLAYEENPALHQLIDAAEIKYPDGISIVRAIRKKYPNAQVTRIAGADLWEALMARAGQMNIPVFLIGGKPQVMEETVAKLRQQWQVNIVGTQHGYFNADESEALFQRVAASGAQIVTVALSLVKPAQPSAPTATADKIFGLLLSRPAVKPISALVISRSTAKADRDVSLL